MDRGWAGDGQEMARDGMWMGCGWISLDVARFYKEQLLPSSGSAFLACPQKRKIGPPLLREGLSIQFAERLAKPL